MGTWIHTSPTMRPMYTRTYNHAWVIANVGILASSRDQKQLSRRSTAGNLSFNSKSYFNKISTERDLYSQWSILAQPSSNTTISWDSDGDDLICPWDISKDFKCSDNEFYFCLWAVTTIPLWASHTYTSLIHCLLFAITLYKIVSFKSANTIRYSRDMHMTKALGTSDDVRNLALSTMWRRLSRLICWRTRT